MGEQLLRACVIPIYTTVIKSFPEKFGASKKKKRDRKSKAGIRAGALIGKFDIGFLCRITQLQSIYLPKDEKGGKGRTEMSLSPKIDFPLQPRLSDQGKLYFSSNLAREKDHYFLRPKKKIRLRKATNKN